MENLTCDKHSEEIRQLSERVIRAELSLTDLRGDLDTLEKTMGGVVKDVDDIKKTLLSVRNWIIGGVAVLVLQGTPLVEVLKKMVM